MATNDGGPVHPSLSHAACIPSEGCRVSPGLSIRDWFAGQALAGLTARSVNLSESDLSEVVYDIADAMLAARAKARAALEDDRG